mgnify:CR=1 FL=1
MKKFIILIPLYNDWKSVFKLLNEIDTSNVEELVNVHDTHSVLREDVTEESIPKEKVIENSPKSKGDYIEIPLVVKKDSQWI